MNRPIYSIFCCLLIVAFSAPLTLPLTSHQVQQSSKYHHNSHLTAYETYHLKPLRTIFTLHLNINGFDYDLSVDTGSADLFVKGHGMLGNPEKQYVCEECIFKNKKVRIGYLDGFLSTYMINANVTLGIHSFN